MIGAGPVGLGMARALKAHGIAYDQIDAASGIGGNWLDGVYPSAHIISSKRSTAYADYPMPAAYPDFPSARQMLDYLQAFARDHDLVRHIETGRRVTVARPLPDERWSVELEGDEQRTYKGVVVCNGHHWDRRWPSYPGEFTGELIHSKDYRDPAQLAGRRVLVIGGGNSACDIASAAARVGASSDLSLRSGYWFLPKTVLGRPLTDLPIWGLPVPVQRLVLRALIRLVIGDYRRYGLPRPRHRLFDRHPTFGTEVLGYIQQGRVRPRPEIARYDGRVVHFKDGTQGEYDLVVAATGFHNSIPFLPKGLVEVRNDAFQIYAGAFPAEVKNLYIVGSNQPRNGFGAILTPAADLYARMIRLQDEIEAPIGAVLKWTGEPLPEHNFLDPGKARRQIWLAQRLLPILKLHAWRMQRAEARRKPADDATPRASEADGSIVARKG